MPSCFPQSTQDFAFLKPGFPLRGTCFRTPWDPESRMAVLCAGGPRAERRSSRPAEQLLPEREPSERAAKTWSAAVSRAPQQRFYLILLSSLGMLTASGSSELSICLFRRCLPFCFEVWHPLCYPKLGHCVKIQCNF